MTATQDPIDDKGVPLIPRSVLFGNPEKVSLSLSPDGTRLAFLAPLDGVLNVWVGPADDPGAARPQNRLSFFAVAELFLAEHLGGRAEPVGENFRGSSIQIRQGAERVPGLPAEESHT